MSAKRKRFDTRTVLIILFIIVIIAAGYIFITNLPAEEETFAPEELLMNPGKYLNVESIVVKGFYVITTEGPSIVSTLSTVTGRPSLRLDYSGVANATDILITDTKYKFTGVLTLVDENNPLGPLIFVAEQIKEV